MAPFLVDFFLGFWYGCGANLFSGSIIQCIAAKGLREYAWGY